MKKLKIIFFTLIVSLLFLSQGFAQTYLFQNKLKLVKQGAVTAANAQYSLVNPAFFYAVGVDLSAYQTGKHLIALYDATGLLIAMGYCSITPPAGETLATTGGPLNDGELITNGTMEADANWNNYLTPTTNERSNTKAYAGTYSRHVVGDSIGDGIQQNIDIDTLNACYKIRAFIWVVSGNGRMDWSGSTFGFNSSTVTGAAWNDIISYRTSIEINHGCSMIAQSYAIGEIYVDNFSVKKLLDPPSTGLRIVNNDKVTQTWVKVGTGAVNGAITYKIWLCN